MLVWLDCVVYLGYFVVCLLVVCCFVDVGGLALWFSGV